GEGGALPSMRRGTDSGCTVIVSSKGEPTKFSTMPGPANVIVLPGATTCAAVESMLTWTPAVAPEKSMTSLPEESAIVVLPPPSVSLYVAVPALPSTNRPPDRELMVIVSSPGPSRTCGVTAAGEPLPTVTVSLPAPPVMLPVSVLPATTVNVSLSLPPLRSYVTLTFTLNASLPPRPVRVLNPVNGRLPLPALSL